MTKQKRKQIDIKSKLKKVDVGVQNGVFIYTGPISLGEFCKKVNINSTEIIKKAFLEGNVMTPNTMLNEEQIGEFCLENDLDFKKEQEVDATNILEALEIDDDEKDLVKRPPIITILGHVDHGKTTLLDTIRKTNVTKGEAGGITQHIGAYQITYKEEKITFLDTPGHEAFTKMRARGSNVTDIVIIVVSAIEGVKPQTLEARDHALASGKPIIVAVNKIDLPNANADAIMSELSENGLVPEEWGGDTIYKQISALKGDGLNDLLDTILTIAEVEEYKANPNRYAVGTVLESKLDKALGPVATVLIQNGTLKLADPLVIGSHFGKIRKMVTAEGYSLKEAIPSTPVKITGLKDVPEVGAKFMAFANEKEAKKIAEERRQDSINKERQHSKGRTMEDLSKEIAEADFKQLNIIIKADVIGSISAIEYVLDKIDIPNTKINIVAANIGVISESDVMLAKASNAQIYAFSIRPNNSIMDIAKQEGVIISAHTIIYKMQEEIEQVLTGMLEPVFKEKITGWSEVIAIFKVPKVGTIGGSIVKNGILSRKNPIRLIRDGVEIYKGKIASMKITTQDVREAKSGYEVGIGLAKYDDIKIGDVFQGFKLIEVSPLENRKNPK